VVDQCDWPQPQNRLCSVYKPSLSIANSRLNEQTHKNHPLLNQTQTIIFPNPVENTHSQHYQTTTQEL
jgi:hypothetical protein